MLKRKAQLFALDAITDDLVQYKGHWIMNCKVTSIDIDMRSKSEKLVIMHVFRQVLSAFNTNVQLTLRKFPLDFKDHIANVRLSAVCATNENLKLYGNEYADFLEELSQGKLDKVNYLTIKTDRKCTIGEANAFLTGIKNQIERIFKSINMEVKQVKGAELRAMYALPDYYKEEADYWIIGSEFKRTYIVLDYPRNGYPNWLAPLIGFPHPIEITQHLHPFPKDKIIHALELSVAKLESTINVQHNIGRPSSEIAVKLNDAKSLLERLASGKDSIVETGMIVTISASSLIELNNISYEIEGAFRQIQVKYRRSMKDTNNAIITSMPLCDDRFMDDNYTFDTLSLSRLIPFTAQDYTSGGILYGINEELSELITFDTFDMINANKVLLGTSGSGKSTLAKLEMGRHLSNKTQAIAIDRNFEYERMCTKLGGQYVRKGEKPNWNHHLIVFSGEQRVKELDQIWNHILSDGLRSRLLVVEEVHNILKEDKELMLNVIREIRKFFVSPTLITQNVKEFLRTDEGQMIIDNCSMKFLMKQGDNDMEELERLFGLSKEEKLYLKTCQRGHGYLYTDLFKTKFKVEYSTKEHHILTTNPKERIANG